MDDFDLAFRIIENTGSNLFLTGRAGTGKTTFLRSLQARSAKRLVVAAPTGVAAINAGGVTLHSLFQLEFGPFIAGQVKRKPLQFSRQKLRLIRSMDILVIDEISMVRADLLDAVDDALRRLRNPSLPFGGVQLLLIGDLRQLPPVVREDDWRLLSTVYQSPYFFSSRALQLAPYVTIELQKVYRQEDPRFLALLNAVRDGHPDPEALAALNRRCRPGFDPDDSLPWIRLSSHNASADAVNSHRMAALRTPAKTFNAAVAGKFPEGAYPADPNLVLKKGAQVMFIKNDPGPAKLFYNGLIGTVTALGRDTVTVMPMTDEEGAEPITTGYVEWENRRYEADAKTGEIREVVEGTFSQIPLRPAWAITIHKSQGLTFTHAIIDAHACFAHGQAYVALSRCKSLEGLVLSTPLPPSAVISDAAVGAYMDACAASRPDAARLSQMEMMYTASTLDALFGFRELSRAYEAFTRAAHDAFATLYPDLLRSVDEVRAMLITDMMGTGGRFMRQYHSMLSDPDALGARLKAAAGYFGPKLAEMADLVSKIPTEHDNKDKAARLERTVDALVDAIQLWDAQLIFLRDNDFSTAGLLKAKAKAALGLDDDETPASSDPKPKKKAPKRQDAAPDTEEIKDKPLYNKLVKWRRERAKADATNPYKVLTNRAMIQLANTRPTTPAALMRVKGIGPVKAAQYGAELLRLCQE